MTDYKKLIERLRNTPNWQRESYGDWKQGTVHYDRAPFEAADAIEALQAENEPLKRQLDADKDVFYAVTQSKGKTMTNVIELAKQAGCEIRNGHAYNQHTGSLDQMLKRFAKLVRNAALEEAAHVCFRSAAYAGDPIDNARLMDCGAVIQKLKEPA